MKHGNAEAKCFFWLTPAEAEGDEGCAPQSESLQPCPTPLPGREMQLPEQRDCLVSIGGWLGGQLWLSQPSPSGLVKRILICPYLSFAFKWNSFDQIECKYGTTYIVGSLLSEYKMTWKKSSERSPTPHLPCWKIQYFWFTWQKTDSQRREGKSKQSTQGWHHALPAQCIMLVNSVLPAVVYQLLDGELQRQGGGRGRQIRGVRVKIRGRSTWESDSWI